MRICKSIILPVTFLWIGFVVAISFLEAWLKFQAPGVTLQIGLGIGKLVFSALNKIELLFALSILISLLLTKRSGFGLRELFFSGILIILLIQTIWLLPALSKRADSLIGGSSLQHSNLHFYYVGLECIKVISLFTFGIISFRTSYE